MVTSTNSWAPSRIEGTNERVGDKDKDGDGELPLDRSYNVNVLVISYFPLTEEGTFNVDVTGDAAVFEGYRMKRKTKD